MSCSNISTSFIYQISVIAPSSKQGQEWNIWKKKLQANWKKILTSSLMLEWFGILLCGLWECFVGGHRTRLKITTGRRLAQMKRDWGNLAPFLCGPGASAQLIMSDPECIGSTAHLWPPYSLLKPVMRGLYQKRYIQCKPIALEVMYLYSITI